MTTSIIPTSRKFARRVRARKCRECEIYYVPGTSHCDCGGSMFPELPLHLKGR